MAYQTLENESIETLPLKGMCVYVSQSVVSDSCDPTDCSLPGSSVHGILQARILEWIAMPFSRGSSQPRDQPKSPTLQADSLLSELPGKPVVSIYTGLKMDCKMLAILIFTSLIIQ